MISCQVIADSFANNSRITTLELSYPRIIHSEMLTHRIFSRNASSSRAIPTSKLLESIERNNLALPDTFYKNGPGMSSEELIGEKQAKLAEVMLRNLWKVTKLTVKGLDLLGVHKQHKNRYLEPFSNITVLITATEWNNFLNLRLAKGAQPEMQALAKAIHEALDRSKPIPLASGKWHTPYGIDRITSTARCARVSYKNHTGRPSLYEEDKCLHDKLLQDRHLSPFEHCARPMTQGELAALTRVSMLLESSPMHSIANNPFIVGNYYKWVSYRRELERSFPSPEVGVSQTGRYEFISE